MKFMQEQFEEQGRLTAAKLEELSIQGLRTDTKLEEQGRLAAAKLEELSADVREAMQQIHTTGAMIGPLLMAHHNPYTETSSITHQQIPLFREQVIAASYPGRVLEMPMPDGQMRTVRDARNPDRIACMISGKLGGSGQIIAAHIMPHSVKATSLLHFGITRFEVDSVRNCLMLSTAIEKAFDRLDVSFVPKDVLHPDTLVLKIWTPLGLPQGSVNKHFGDAQTIPLWDGSAFQIGMFEGHELFCGSNLVLKSALSNQAWYAFLRSKTLGWVDAEDSVPDHFGTPERESSEFQQARKDYVLRVLGDPEARGAAAVAAAAALFASSCPYNLGGDAPEEELGSEQGDQ
jgi:hypothetical protein